MNGKKRRGSWGRKLLSAALSILLAAQSVLPTAARAQEAEQGLSLDNGYILTEVDGRNGCFDIRTVEGDKVNKDDNNKNLLFPNGDDATSFTSFQVTRGGQTKEYIFGGSYEGSSPVTVRQTANELIAAWSVDGLTFTQTIRLVNSGSNEHGMVYLSYTVANTGAPAQVKARILLDTALGNQDYAYYRVGTDTVQSETALGGNGYNKSFYCYDDPFAPKITAYVVNASLNNAECKPYQTVFAHWNNLAAAAFDYTPDPSMTFTNFNNRKYLTADSACALYYEMGEVAQSAPGTVALNYGVYSNEKVTAGQTAAVNVTAPDVMTLNSGNTVYENDGKFTVETPVENIGTKTYEKVRIVLYTTGSLQALDENGNVVETTYDEPYYREVNDFVPGQTQTISWNLQALPQAEGVYACASFKVYDVSDGATQGTGTLLADNLMGEGSAWVLCPGTVEKTPQIQFTGSSPDVLYSSGSRTFYAAGKNFSMLSNTGDYKLMLSRVDGQPWNGQTEMEIPKFYIDAGKNTMTVTMDDDAPGELPEGQYQLTIDYTDTSKKDVSAPALRFAVKQEEKYRNEAYGLLVAVKSGKNAGSTYSIRTFANEEAYEAELESGSLDRENALLEFRGIFSRRQSGGVTVYTGTSSGSGDNVMTLNSCLDIENGAVTITEKGGSVSVDFDAGIYTTGSRTSVWKGVAALTELKAGEDYGLIQYDKSGDREAEPANTITLLWPSVGQAAQNLLGFLMEFKYGELGVIQHDNAEETRVVGFGAAMDLNFVIPSFQETVDDRSLLGDAYNAAIHTNGELSAAEIRSLNDQIPYNVDTVNTNAGAEDGTEEEDESKSVSGSIQIDDVLFGGGFLGVNMAVSLAVPAYVEGTPSLEGTLTLKTVGDWAVGVEGSADFSVFCMEGEIAIKSKNNIPVPDSIHFFLGNCTPGICLDPCGVLWIQGAGGGIENLYDTIFLTDSIPPLKLILDAQFSLMQIISAKASLSLSLRGIGVTLTEGKVANQLPVMDRARLQVDWYPEFYFLSSVEMSIADIITGGGYIVVEQSGFFEFFVNASVQVPEDIPIIGGVKVASAGLGANAEKIWGQIKALGASLGVVYYWGGSVEWGGGAAANPTYPELLSRAVYRDIPVYADAATGRTLYAAVGTNLLPGAAVSRNASRRAAGPQNTLTSNGRGIYTLTLDQKRKDELLILEWQADSLEMAESDVENITIRDENSLGKEIVLLDQAQPAEGQPDANANLTFNEETGTATLAVSFTAENEFSKQWTITAPNDASVVLYDLEPMPELSGAAVERTGNNMTVTLNGTAMDRFDTIRFMAVEKNSEEATLVHQATKESGPINATQTFSLPEDLPSGSYELRIVANDENSQYHSEISEPFTHTNANEPDSPAKVTAECAGDYKLDVSVIAPADDDFDGYRVNVYDAASGEEIEGVSGLLFTRDGQPVRYNEDGTLALPGNNAAASTTMTVGGQYQFKPEEKDGKVKTLGLKGGQNYRIGVSTWKQVATGGGNVLFYSEAAPSDSVTMRERVETVISFQADADYVNVTEEREVKEGGPITFTTPTYRKNSLDITMTSSQGVGGTWKLDGRERPGGGGSGKRHTLSLTDLAEGTHTLEFTGKNASGDTVRGVYTFGVDTLPPRLLLSSPMSGSFYDDTEELTVEGITDANARITVEDITTGVTYDSFSAKTDMEGRFTETLRRLEPGLASHTLAITATDAVGNSTQQTVELLNAGLGSIKELSIYSGGEDITNASVQSGEDYPLTLVAELENGGTMEINDDTLVEWRQTTVNGDAVLAWEDGTYALETSLYDRGMVSAHFLGSDLGSESVAFAYAPAAEEPDLPPDIPDPGPDGPGPNLPHGGSGAYAISVKQPEHGTVAVNMENATAGDTVIITVTPDIGYTLDILTVTDDTGEELSLTDNGNGQYVFRMPSGNVAVSVIMRPACPRDETCPIYAFPDADPAEWYHDGVHYCIENGLMNGYGNGKFGPNNSLTRGMLAQILYNREGKPSVAGSSPFVDVAGSAWYAAAVIWAAGNGIVGGYGNGRYGPEDPITREQLATILWRYDGSPENTGRLDSFTDGNKASGYAVPALQWAVEQGIVNGRSNGSLDPRGKATRAEVAAMLQRYLRKAEQ